MPHLKQPAMLNIKLFNVGQAVSMFVALCCCFCGFAVLTAVKKLNDPSANIEIILLLSGCILIISGMYHTTAVINQISDPYLFYFYNRLNLKRYRTKEDFSVYFVGVSILLLSGLIWTFLYAQGVSDTLFAAFATSALIPILAMSIRIRKRLTLYRMVNSISDDDTDSSVISDEPEQLSCKE